MAVTYGFFNSLDGDRVYNADQMSEYFEGLVSNGVYESVGGALQVLAGDGLAANVQTGRAIIEHKWVRNDAVLTLPITAAHATLNRYTAVIIRLDYTNREITITTKDGTPASTPSYPSMTHSATIQELCLAYILVGASATRIAQANITDMRPSSLCGWVTGLIKQVDTSTLFLQWQDAYQAYYDAMTEQFQDWFDQLTSQLSVNTYIQEYKKITTLEGSSTAIPLDMTGYAYSPDDIIDVYVNGLKYESYTLDASASPATITPSVTANGTEVEIRAIKSKIGFYVIADSNGDLLVNSDDEVLEV